jgi:hypothetical protein
MADTRMEIKHHARFEPPELPPVLMVETTASGWRGLTMDGVVLNVESSNGHVAAIPFGDRIAVNRNGILVGYRAIPQRESPGSIDRYLKSFNIARRAAKNSEHLTNALIAVETALSFAPTLAAHYNRGMILLELGRWREGFADYKQATEHEGSAFMRPQYRDCIEFGLKRWHGEDISGKRILLIHDHGFGDSIMALRYVPVLKAMGADVMLWMPPELERLAAQCAPVVSAPVSADFFCPMLMLLEVLQQSPESIPSQPYLEINPELVREWRARLNLSVADRLTGVAWSPGVVSEDDYPRDIPLGLLVKALPGVRLISLQQQGKDEAASLGVEHPSFEDFESCAALMACCDRVVSIDTAAVHLAGALGHADVSLLLSHWASWRWLAPLYPTVKICRQDAPGDWDSALAKLK